MFFRRCAFVAFWIVLGLFVIRQPENAAQAVRALVGGLALLADALSRFVAAF
ncbi:hypothetical protein AGRA3207_004800 [Actinomadura graeca]|uniref:Uncharacterized protein n=1 Tax=Actinomadura graeca TaxID=2750812 RepID=A0ABX8R3M8_9ACTN|nr:hypothetical protein [Actinomadura graeca]QXJ23618.1 hypothetical protein AGRA3207_004800 [Actinomadura graeca]